MVAWKWDRRGGRLHDRDEAAEQTPLSASGRARLRRRAGIPVGVISLFPDTGRQPARANRQTGIDMSRSPDMARRRQTSGAKRRTTLKRITVSGRQKAEHCWSDAGIRRRDRRRSLWPSISIKAKLLSRGGSRLFVEEKIHDKLVIGAERRSNKSASGRPNRSGDRTSDRQ